ncbi:pleckstrin-like protein [Diplodia corticola]|uniref:Pleckstrin-like protein n=1 Tax=Diplodia corticola TaxID=236234 RepID=A0A1J9QYQ2_9PEZI|nr:pleckstrin-like protein [Diplodia corticola]OJD33513.1 pleckstrin-like protein [Diplodia corticola]
MAAAEPQPAPAPAGSHQEPKFSRYRSVRRAHQHQHQHDPPAMPPLLPPEPTQPAPASATVSRSMSRYRRQRPVTATAPVAHDRAAPPLPTQPVASSAREQRRVRAASNPAQPPNHQTSRPSTARAQGGAPDHNVLDSPTRAREEARRLLEGESQRQARMNAQLKAEKRAKLEEAERQRAQLEAEESERRNAERVRQYQEKRAEDLRVRQETARAQAAQARQEEDDRVRAAERERPRTGKTSGAGSESDAPQVPHSPESPSSFRKKDRLAGLLRRRKDDHQPDVAFIPAPKPRQVSNNDNSNSDAYIKAGGGGVVPGIDAPVSAVNAGDRRVMVECKKKKILLPVTPTTTPQELIRTASNVLSEDIDAKASVLLEFFAKVSVQRPLRNYEHVRDVLNSWDDDMQNSLILVESPNGGNDAELKVSSVPSEKPGDYSCWMQYSQKPGRWSKRYITLRNDGQVLVAKNESAKDVANACHLSDFDIYSPSAEAKSRRVKPPKKFCFAIKSQQKSTMFMSTSTYVHFFCSNDQTVAADFYSAIQGWRSWYLVNVMGEGQKKARAAEQAHASAHPVPGNQLSLPAMAVHRPSTSIDSHYQLGSFRPLLDMTQFESASGPKLARSPTDDDSRLADGGGLHGRNQSMRTREHPQLTSPTHLTSPGGLSNVTSPTTLIQKIPSEDEDGTFAAGGLLGRAYSQRQKQLTEREKNLKNSGPFTEGPSLLSSTDAIHPRGNRTSLDGGRPQRMSSVRSTRGGESSEIKRTASTRRAIPKPLVDLTPQYQEPPQFSKKGKGFRPDHLGGGLVDAATSPDVPIPIPPSQDWRARRDPSATRPGTSGVDRTKSLRGQGQRINYIANNHANVPENGAEGFTGHGLIATTNFGPTASAVPFGHGVMDGSKAKGPMIDLSEGNRFQPGSLLDRVATTQPKVPIIDRE